MPLYDESTLDDLRERMSDYLQTVCGITNLRRPFRCLTPSHEDTHPSMSYDPRRNCVKCWSCGAGGDVFDVAGWVEGASCFTGKVEAVARAVGYPLHTCVQTAPRRPRTHPQKPVYDMPAPIEGIDLSSKLGEATRALFGEPQGKVALDYLRGRGFGEELISDSAIGWVKHPSVVFPNMRAPHCDDGYFIFGFPVYAEDGLLWESHELYDITFPYAVFRMCKEGAEPKELKPPGLASPIWYEHLLWTGVHNPSEPVYVVEGIYDAMSLWALERIQACAICGASGTTRLLQVLAHAPKANRPDLVLAFDSDEAGARYTDTVSKGLNELCIQHFIAPPYPYGCKDANEMLMLERGCHGQ